MLSKRAGGATVLLATDECIVCGRVDGRRSITVLMGGLTLLE